MVQGFTGEAKQVEELINIIISQSAMLWNKKINTAGLEWYAISQKMRQKGSNCDSELLLWQWDGACMWSNEINFTYNLFTLAVSVVCESMCVLQDIWFKSVSLPAVSVMVVRFLCWTLQNESINQSVWVGRWRPLMLLLIHSELLYPCLW